jgi:hypothetical protein
MPELYDEILNDTTKGLKSTTKAGKKVRGRLTGIVSS